MSGGVANGWRITGSPFHTPFIIDRSLESCLVHFVVRGGPVHESVVLEFPNLVEVSVVVVARQFHLRCMHGLELLVLPCVSACWGLSLLKQLTIACSVTSSFCY
jgi:hypothetical protein